MTEINLDKLNKIIDELKEDNINELLHKDSWLFNYRNISEISDILKIHNDIKKIYINSLNLLNKRITYINSIEKMMKNKKNKKCNECEIYKDLFLEIESIIAFFKISFVPGVELVMQFNVDYHHMKMLYMYLYSTFDRIACLLFNHFSDKNMNNTEFGNKMKKIYFDKVNSYLNDSKDISIELKQEINSIINSSSFIYIKKIRNGASHHFDNPMLRYHLSTDLMICFIVLVKLIIDIHNLI